MEQLTLLRDLGPEELLARWRENRATLLAAAAELQDGQRLPWYGPSMSAKSFLTARLMECWAHRTDVVDAVDAHRPPPHRPSHLPHQGFLPPGWTYPHRGARLPP